MPMSWDVIVVGAGAAGLIAAERAASRGLKTLLLEKNRKAGVKILMSGGTRCNVTHNTDERGIIAAFGRNGRFLHSALARLSPRDVVALLADEGVATKIEETGKIFPRSDKALDVLQALLARLERSGATLTLGTAVIDVEKPPAESFLIRTASGEHAAHNLIITVGGLSYPGSGTTGDGFVWAHQFGHRIVPAVPALAPLKSNAAWVHALSGLTIEDANLTLQVMEPASATSPTNGNVGKKRKPDPLSYRGSTLFTHLGLSGPAPMNISRGVSYADPAAAISVRCDFLPNESLDALFQRLRTACQREGRKQLGSVVPYFVPHRLAAALLQQAAIPTDRPAAEISNADLRRLCEWIKQAEIPITGTLGFPKAEVTAGGVSLEEVDSRTMESKLCPGLFFAGEVLDLDGPIGGFNFQSAFSTGWLAGLSVGETT